MSLLSRLLPAGPSGFGYGTTAEAVTAGLSLAGKTVLVTGATAGLGRETVRVLALRGARVLATARTLDKARAVAAMIGGDVVPLACELANPTSVRACVAEVARGGHVLDAIIANAGIMALPALQMAHGVELQLFTNHVGHFILVTGLVDRLAPDGRVVMVSSDAHRRAPRAGIEFDNLDGAKGYGPWRAYGQSKLANLLFAKQLARRLAGSRRTANALHPGVIDTELVRHVPLVKAAYAIAGPLAMKSIPEGAATQVYAATHPSLVGVSGRYFSHCNEASPRRDADDVALAQRLWDTTEAIVARLPA